MKICIACGMPMTEPEDFALRDPSKEYCRYCCRPDGDMQDFEEKKEGMTHFIMETQGIAKEVAEKAALNAMKNLPAWKEHLNEE